jgi:acid stress-induced BolA-like protein IbaG/YrbA
VGLPDKIIAAIQSPLAAEYIRLDDDDGITGFVVSRKFENMSTLDRQSLIDEALRNATDPLSTEEQRQVLMIAGLTPAEYESAGARIRVREIREQGDGSLEVLLHGGYSDAVYVKGALNNEKGVQTTEPEPCPDAVGILMRFRAKGTEVNPLTRARAIKVLQADRYIQVMQDA